MEDLLLRAQIKDHGTEGRACSRPGGGRRWSSQGGGGDDIRHSRDSSGHLPAARGSRFRSSIFRLFTALFFNLFLGVSDHFVRLSGDGIVEYV